MSFLRQDFFQVGQPTLVRTETPFNKSGTVSSVREDVIASCAVTAWDVARLLSVLTFEVSTLSRRCAVVAHAVGDVFGLRARWIFLVVQNLTTVLPVGVTPLPLTSRVSGVMSTCTVTSGSQRLPMFCN